MTRKRFAGQGKVDASGAGAHPVIVKIRLLPILLWLLATGVAPAAEAPRLTAAERAQGWRLLFDGKSLRDWRGLGLSKAPKSWRVGEGELRATGEPALVGEELFENFELTCEWLVEAGGSAAVHFRLGDEDLPLSLGGVIFELAGPEATTGGNGGLHPPSRAQVPEPDRWHTARLLVYGNRVEYWIDGGQVNGYSIDGRDWRTAVSSSRFQVVPDYGLARRGPVALSGERARFKNIKARPL